MRGTHAAWEQLQLLRSQMKSFFKQREDLVDGALVALLGGVHLLVVGPPGTAKSMVAETLCRQLLDARYFYMLLNKFMTWKEVACGPTTVREVEDGNGRSVSFRNTEGALLRAHVAFLDEIFKAAGVTLNSALGLLQERVCTINAGEKVQVPLLSVFAASNEMPAKDEEQLRAFADRFVLRYEVHYLSVSQDEDTDFIDMIAGRQPLPDASLSLEELFYFQKEAARVQINEAIFGSINAVRATLRLQHGVEPSDRRYKESLKVLRAFAYLNGHAQVELEDLSILEHVLWLNRDPKERDAVRKVVADVARSPVVSRAAELVREAEAIHNEAREHLGAAAAVIPFDGPDQKAQHESLRQVHQREQRLGEIHQTLTGLQANAGESALPMLRTYCNQVNVFRKNLVEMRTVENPFVGAGRWPAKVM